LGSPNIAKLVELIEQKRDLSSIQQKLPANLVKIQAGHSSKKPLFLVHPVGGNVFFYRHLAIDLGAEQPVYGLQAQGIDGEEQPLTTIEEMATQYVAAVRVVQPEGPYLLGGTSFGGTVAFEMAQQLHALEQKVAMLIIIDAPIALKTPKELHSDIGIITYLLNVGDDVDASSLEQLRQLSSEEQMRYFLENSQIAKELSHDTALEQIRHFLNIFKLNLQAMRDYKPKRYVGQILFFAARERDEINLPNPERGWLDLATVEVYEVPGNHITINYPPHINVVAKHIKDYLSKLGK
jgi:thioesterase domain-containing protein